MMAVIVLTCLALGVLGAPHSLVPDQILQPDTASSPAHVLGWTVVARANPEQTLKLTIAMTQKNLDVIKSKWYAIADPSSPEYGRFLSSAQLEEIISPDESSVDQVIEWITTTAPSATTSVTKLRDFITVTLSVADAERLLGTELSSTRHPLVKQPRIRTFSGYTLPTHINRLVDFVGGVSDFSIRTSRFAHRHLTLFKAALSANSANSAPAPRPSFANVGNHEIELRFIPLCPGPDYCSPSTFTSVISGFTAVLKFTDGTTQLQTVGSDGVGCEGDEQIYSCSFPISNIPNWVMFDVALATNFTSGEVSDFAPLGASLTCTPWSFPSTVSKLYNVTEQDKGVTTSEGVVLFEQQYYNPSDFSAFMAANNLVSTPAAVVNPTDPNVPDYPGEEGQADIELEAANGVGGDNSTYWYSSDGADGVLQWALQVSNSSDDDVPKVWSLSWGVPEAQFDQWVGPGVQARIDAELIKMGVRGLTLVVASGDAGVRPVGRSEATCGVFEPDYPASSEFVLTVSATMLKLPSKHRDLVPSKEDLPICDLRMSGVKDDKISCDTTGLEEAYEVAVSCCSDGAVWTTGGGFSLNYTQPKWQKDAVEGYLAKQANLPPLDFWSRTGRAYPDLSVVGDKIPTLRYGNLENFGGTSASAPIMAGLLSQLNLHRLAQGKTLLGPVTPLLYTIAAEHPEAFQDILEGHSNCGELECCDYGFQADVGWDSVTGLGTPNIGILKTLI